MLLLLTVFPLSSGGTPSRLAMMGGESESRVTKCVRQDQLSLFHKHSLVVCFHSIKHSWVWWVGGRENLMSVCL